MSTQICKDPRLISVLGGGGVFFVSLIFLGGFFWWSGFFRLLGVLFFVCFVLCVCLVCFLCSTLLFFHLISPTKREGAPGQMLSGAVIYDKAIRGTEGLAGILIWRQRSLFVRHTILRF